jgi:hypothetical protein
LELAGERVSRTKELAVALLIAYDEEVLRDKRGLSRDLSARSKLEVTEVERKKGETRRILRAKLH